MVCRDAHSGGGHLGRAGFRIAGAVWPSRRSGGHAREIGMCAEEYSGPVWQCVRNEHIESCIGIFGNMSPRWSAPASW